MPALELSPAQILSFWLLVHDGTIKVINKAAKSTFLFLLSNIFYNGLVGLWQPSLSFPVFNFSGLVANFARKGLSAREMIVLSGAHTTGKSHCNGILPHLYNFTGADNATDTDPALDKGFTAFLKHK
ncbi:hypothetical protein R1flu_017958 [Riccia fluitans]|uniref:Plant heme peroxidase family profile domain-containing protein n=1 Tax=Riccia fluitans TaxID=41844 RepID=A0ABD1ZEF5_9MARC